MNLTSTFEGVGIALDALRSNKVRAALTILGIVIGVTVVITMAAAIGGLRGTVLEQVEAIGPKNFIVDRFDNTAIRVDDGTEKPPWAGKPPITFAEADLLSRLPAVHAVAAAIDTQADVKWGSKSVLNIPVLGRGWRWVEYIDGEFLRGRNYVESDEAHAAPAGVISEHLAGELFGERDPVGRQVRVGRELITVVGVFRQTPNLFSSQFKDWVIMPAQTLHRRLGVTTDFMQLLVVTASGATQEEAMDQVTAALRISRGIRPGADNTFVLTRPEQFTEVFNKVTGVFFAVMLVLSGIGLIVGGVGVIGIMMISVTERTREIGVRKALGATRREILWQFLVESVTVTVVGGGIGILLASFFAWMLRTVTPVPAQVPLWAVAASIGMAAFAGIVFGLYPAAKAARLDPVEALRYE
ncbi:MAG TPA: ABC transporter permease [Longimicrobium sp.]|nr:ABC transporter permease [Longimicrobium sp.]